MPPVKEYTHAELDALVALGLEEGESVRSMASQLGVDRGRVARSVGRIRKGAKAAQPPAGEPTSARGQAALARLAQRHDDAPSGPPDAKASLADRIRAELEVALSTGNLDALSRLSIVLRRLPAGEQEPTEQPADLSGLSDGELAVYSCGAWLAAGKPSTDRDTAKDFAKLIAFASPEAKPKVRSEATEAELARYMAGDLDALPPGHPLSRAARSSCCIACHTATGPEHRVCGECCEVVVKLRNGMPLAGEGETVLGRAMTPAEREAKATAALLAEHGAAR